MLPLQQARVRSLIEELKILHAMKQGQKRKRKKNPDSRAQAAVAVRPKALSSVRPRVRDAQGTQETQRLSSEARPPTQLLQTHRCLPLHHPHTGLGFYNHRHGGEIGQHEELTLESMLETEVVS